MRLWLRFQIHPTNPWVHSSMRTDTSNPSDSIPTDPEPILKELLQDYRETAAEVVPWFLQAMPRMYFQDTEPETQLSHLRTIIALKASGGPLEITMRSEDGRMWTAMRPSNHPGTLAEILAGLPLEQSLRSATIHSAADGSFVLESSSSESRIRSIPPIRNGWRSSRPPWRSPVRRSRRGPRTRSAPTSNAAPRTT